MTDELLDRSLQTHVLTSWCEDRIANYFPQYVSQANQPGSFCLVYGDQFDQVGLLRGINML